MKLVALLALFVVSSIDPVIAQVQPFRGAPGGMSGSVGPAQTTPQPGQPRSGFATGPAESPRRGTYSTPRGVAIHNPPGGAVIQPLPHGAHIQTGPALVVPRVISTPHHRPVPIIAPQPLHRPPKHIVVGVVPHIHHRPWFYYRYPVTTIVEWPYVYSPTVITQIAPGVISTGPRYGEEPPSEARTRSPGQLAPFDPTPLEVVERMLLMANVKADDVLYDLGAGDGRVVIAAAKKYGIRAIGYEIDPGLAKLARENAQRQGVGQLVEIREQDFLTADLSRASVVTLYLSYDGNLAVRSQLMKQLRAGARVVSYTFDMAEWQPKISETYRDAGGDAHAIYLWQIGDAIAFR